MQYFYLKAHFYCKVGFVQQSLLQVLRTEYEYWVVFEKKILYKSNGLGHHHNLYFIVISTYWLIWGWGFCVTCSHSSLINWIRFLHMMSFKLNYHLQCYFSCKISQRFASSSKKDWSRITCRLTKRSMRFNRVVVVIHILPESVGIYKRSFAASRN